MKTLALLVLIWGISLNHLSINPPAISSVDTLSVNTLSVNTPSVDTPSVAPLANASVDSSPVKTLFDIIPIQPEFASAYAIKTSPENEATCASTELLRRQMIELINKARAQPRTCGEMQFKGAPPLRWNYSLEKAAKLHSHRMATQNFFAHRGPDSTHVGIRVQMVGYNWRYVGENIYAGIETVTEAVYGWLESEGHCKTIMNPDYTELGAACETNRASQYESYWTQVFASPM